jgi:L-rhamnose mutarotase
MVTHGQIIKLKPGTREPYAILHRNTFPGVLDRIQKSSLSHYSIFLHDDVLFGYYEYTGSNYQFDMQAISEDPCTQEWWKLTSPLQEPLPDRKPGEWWSELESIYCFVREKRSFAGATKRIAFRISGIEILQDAGIEMAIIENEPIRKNILKFQVFKRTDELFLYLESGEDIETDLITESFKKTDIFKGQISEMEEVFHTSSGPANEKRKKVFVTGCFDMLHSGHIEFLREASSFGDLYVCIGSDANILKLKGRPTVNTQEERNTC